MAATTRQKRPLVGASKIGLKVGKVLNRYHVGKHFKIDITDNSFSYKRKIETIEREAALDGLYVIRTSVSVEVLGVSEIVLAYKSLSKVGTGFSLF